MLLSRRCSRKGLSLLEVILAMAIFLMSITGLTFLMGIASDHALESQMRSQAISICQSRLAEVSSGAIALEGQGPSACEDDNDFQWSMDVEPGSYNGLSNVTIRVTRKRANGSQLECSLSQMVFDPKSIGTVFDAAKDTSATGSATDTSGSDTSSSGASGTTPAATAPKASSTSSSSKRGS